jgi:uracil-DNA glycosylase family 4
MSYDTLPLLREEVSQCRRCPRLVHWRETVPAKPSFTTPYWRRPVPGFGDKDAWLILIGLAPAPHGGNRTGRPFTGDLSGAFLMRCLYNQGFASQPTSTFYNDGLTLYGCYMTASVKCVPPLHKPTPQEFRNCSGFLHREFALLPKISAVLALGKDAFDAYLRYVKQQGIQTRGTRFSFGACVQFEGLPTLYGSYHPTPRNTNTGTLTAQMFEDLLKKIRRENAQDSNVRTF